MRVLGVGSYNDLGSIYLRLVSEGHEVRVHISEEGAHDVLEGLITRVPRWEDELPWIREAGDDGLIVFEDVGRGALQDRLRQEGFHVVGGSALGDRLEQDRGFGQQVLRDLGMRTLPTHACRDFDEGLALLAAAPGRYVLKFDGSDLPSDLNYVGMRDDGADVIGLLRRHARTWNARDLGPPRFVLMAHVKGVETGLGAFFNGESFIGPVNLDWEHKRLFPGDLGELTGEMGTVVTYRGGEKLFDATLGRLAPLLREARHIGYVNLNTIINDDGIWPLELTCRFGYPGFAILTALFAEEIGGVLQRIARGSTAQIATHDGFAVGVVLTVPPFPYHHGYEELGKGAPVYLPDDLTVEDRTHLHLGEVAHDGAQLLTAGLVGQIMVVTGRGPAIADAQQAAYRLAKKIAIPNVRYRNDIGDALRTGELETLARLGWLEIPSSRR